MPQAYPESYYLATAKGLAERPALAGDLDCDVCVVGGGFTGLSAALHLAERGYDVVLLEAERIAWGASGRNGGQLGSGQRVGQEELEGLVGRNEARRLWDLAEAAKAAVRDRVARHDIDCDLKAGSLAVAYKAGDMDWMARNVALLNERYGYDQVSLLSKAALEERLASSIYHGGFLDQGAGHLHPLNYALGLARAAEAAGARLFEGSPVTGISGGEKPCATTAAGKINARYLVLGCNAYLENLAPRIAGNIMPINNFILATAPLGEAGARALIRDDAAVHDSKFVVDYYRLSADHRLLFGGGETYRRALPADIKSFVRRPMLQVFPQLADTPIDYAWGGTVGITMNRLPDFGRLEDTIFYAQGFSGHGVALTTLAGQVIAEALAGTAERFDVMARLPTRRFPGGTLLRAPALVLGMLYYALRDKL